MIKSYRDQGVIDIKDGINSARARRALPAKFWISARDALGILDTATAIEQIRQVPHLRLHKLKGKLLGYWSITFSSRGRILFLFDETRAEVSDVSITPDHYGD